MKKRIIVVPEEELHTSLQPSHVLKGVGSADADADSAIRISIDPTMDEADLRYGVDVLRDRVPAPRQGF